MYHPPKRMHFQGEGIFFSLGKVFYNIIFICYFMIEISKSVIIKNGKYLLLKRASHSKAFPDLWDFAGGKHDPGETSLQAVIRETREETSYEIIPEIEIKKEEYHDEQYDLLFHYFSIKELTGDLKLSTFHSEFKWVSKDDIKNYDLHPCVRLFFE
jgi:mutator protein MutT